MFERKIKKTKEKQEFKKKLRRNTERKKNGN